MNNKVIKAGCILLNEDNKNICLVYRKKQNDYSFPKGHLEEKESIIECAIRETEEETKRIPKIIINEPLYIEKYITPKGEDVLMYYYFAIDNGKSNNDSTDTHETIWMNLEDVRDKLSYESLKLVWDNVNDKILDYIKSNEE